MRKLAVPFLILEGIGTIAWWATLMLFPAARAPFLAPGAPDSTLLAFGAADMVLYSGAPLAAAYGLARRLPWAWPLLCIHAGAVIYAGLYGLMLPLVSGGGWPAALFMTPGMLILPILVWRLRPGGDA